MRESERKSLGMPLKWKVNAAQVAQMPCAMRSLMRAVCSACHGGLGDGNGGGRELKVVSQCRQCQCNSFEIPKRKR